jgi:hypothetical protein
MTKVRDNAVVATAVDQTKNRFQTQVLAAKICDLKDGWIGVSRGETAAVLNRRGAVIHPENGKTFGSQPPANLTVSAPHVNNALIFREPAGVDRFNEFLLGLVGFPVGAKFRVLPPALPSIQVSPVHQLETAVLGNRATDLPISACFPYSAEDEAELRLA